VAEPSSAPSASPSSPSSPSPPSGAPTVTLMQSGTVSSQIDARVVDLLTDGSVNVTSSNERFLRGQYAYADSFKRVVPILYPGAVDFGGGVASSTGSNVFIGARTTEILVTHRNETISALNDIWNANQQGASRSGIYLRMKVFTAGDAGKNVTIRHIAVGSTVTVGPAPVPTPTPSVSPSTSPTSSPT
jgi:hypothetical protein